MVIGFEIIQEPRYAAVTFCLKRIVIITRRAVWKGIVGVTPTNTPMAIPIAMVLGSPLRLINLS